MVKLEKRYGKILNGSNMILLMVAMMLSFVIECKAEDNNNDAGLRVALFNWTKPFEALDLLKSMHYDVALITSVPGDNVAKHAQWAKEIARRDMKFMPLLWWTPPGSAKFTHLRYIDRSGKVFKAPCPLDERYWDRQVRDRFEKISQISKKGIPLYGIGIDLEFYWAGTETITYPSHCYCDNCIKQFSKKQGLSGPIPPASKRHEWLKAKNLLDELGDFESERVKQFASEAAAAAVKNDPSLNFGIMLYLDQWFNQAVRDGFLTGGTKVLACTEYSYNTGYTPSIDSQKASLDAVGNVLFIPGIWNSKYQWLSNEKTAHHIYQMVRHSDGYFIGPIANIWETNGKYAKYWPPERQKSFIEIVRKAHLELEKKAKDKNYQSPYDKPIKEDFELPHSVVNYLTQPPQVDGILNDRAWSVEASTLRPFVLTHYYHITPAADGSRDRTPIAGTIVQMGYDDKNLYIAVTCHEPKMNLIKATQTVRDAGRIVDDDSFYVRLDTKGGQGADFTFATNLLTTKLESIAGVDSRDWNGDWQVATQKGTDRWTIEMAIPFKTLGLDKPPTGKTWRAEFTRPRRGIDYQQEEHTAWSGVTGNADPTKYGTLKFAEKSN